VTLEDDAFAKALQNGLPAARGRRRCLTPDWHERACLGRACEWSGITVCSAIIARFPDYELDDVLIVEEPEKLRAIADVLRSRIVTLLNERAASTTELAQALGVPKGTAGHHVKVLEKAGLVRVVRTRKVRALTEKYYGRVARLFVLKGEDAMPDELRGGALVAIMLRQAADEAIATGTEKDTSALLHVRLAHSDVLRFQRRLNRLVADLQRSEDPEGEMYALALALFPGTVVLPPRGDDA
jgi:DNA-binding transcriptional ArsR family regulator